MKSMSGALDVLDRVLGRSGFEHGHVVGEAFEYAPDPAQEQRVIVDDQHFHRVQSFTIDLVR